MKNIKVLSLAFMIIAILAGCAGNKDMIAKTSISTRQDVFQEIQPSQAIPVKTQLNVELAVKNFKSRLVNSYSKHTNQSYTAVLNIDGQAVVLSDEGVMEELSGDAKDNPEVGAGFKYNFKKSLVLQPGKHRISITLPISDVIVEKEIDLKDGANTLKLSPVYKTHISKKPDYPVFSAGIQAIRVQLNNQDL